MRSVLFMSGMVLLAAQALAQGPTRDKVPLAETWNLKDLYASDTEAKAAKSALETQVKKLSSLEPKLGVDAKSFLATLDEIMQVGKDLDRLAIYTHLQSDQNTRDAGNLALRQEVEVLATNYSSAIAWLKPAVLKLGDAKVKTFIKQQKALSIYAPVLDDILRMAPHTRSPAEEKILADAGLIADAPYNIYSILANADIKFPKVKLSKGKPFELNQAAYTLHRASSNRADRSKVFKTFWQVFKEYSRTLGVMLDANVKRDIFYARSRGYDSSLAAALGQNNVPVSVYKNLITDIHKNLPTLHRYLKLRARMLNVKKLGYHDLYTPLVKKVDLKYNYSEGKKLVLEALTPLGNEYTTALGTGFENRWIDVHPTAGKRSGAYSAGDAFDVHPYILLNYNGNYDDVSTLAHEAGHTMHSWFSNKNQPYPTADYSIFVAEVASTTNEGLLIRYMLEREKKPEVRLFLLGSYLESMRTTIFRQTMFAEFELAIHEASERGEALTGEKLAQMYGELLKTYHGHDQGVCEIDELYNYEWGYIPHFYYNFYVFQYATGMVAATAFVEQIRTGGDNGREAYLSYLKSGSSRYPIDVLKTAGVDLTTSAPFDSTMKVMNELMDEIEVLLKARK